MMHTTKRWRLAAATGALALGGTTLAVAAPAGAATGPMTYTCTNPLLGTFQVGVDVDSVGDRVYVGDAQPLKAQVTVPDSVRNAAYTVLNARQVDGTAKHALSGGSIASPVDLTIARTAVPASGPLVLNAAGSVKHATPGDETLRAGALDATLNFSNDAGASVGQAAVSCTAPTPNVAIDTVTVVARSTTTLTVKPVISGFGQTVRATAKVAVTGGKPAGKVTFAVDGSTVAAEVNNGGLARADLPLLSRGRHQVTATFTPTDATHYDGSTSAPVKATVTKDGTISAATLRHKSGLRWLVAKDKVVSRHGQPVTGKVKFVLHRNGHKVGAKIKTLDQRHRARAVFKRVKRHGHYTVVARYLGAPDFRRSRAVARSSF